MGHIDSQRRPSHCNSSEGSDQIVITTNGCQNKIRKIGIEIPPGGLIGQLASIQKEAY